MTIQNLSPDTGQEGCVSRNGKAPLGNGASGVSKTTQKFSDLQGNYTRKLPPFGKQLAIRLRQGDKPSNCVWVACGVDAWGRAKYDLRRSDSAALCLPCGDDPTLYRWPVSGLDCLVVHTGGLNANTLRTLGAELVRAGATLVVIIGVEDELNAPIVSFKPRRAEV